MLFWCLPTVWDLVFNVGLLGGFCCCYDFVLFNVLCCLLGCFVLGSFGCFVFGFDVVLLVFCLCWCFRLFVCLFNSIVCSFKVPICFVVGLMVFACCFVVVCLCWFSSAMTAAFCYCFDFGWFSKWLLVVGLFVNLLVAWLLDYLLLFAGLVWVFCFFNIVFTMYCVDSGCGMSLYNSVA